MDLPLVLNLTLGLIFLYLILSLLASEIQELIATVLQWRAEHLKKSIEILLTGDSEGAKESLGIEFADRLYRNPIVRSLNQQAKGPLAEFFRRISHGFEAAYRNVTGGRAVFGKKYPDDPNSKEYFRSGPSYIPAASFAIALLNELEIDDLTHGHNCKLLRRAVDDRLQLIRSLITSLSSSPQSDLMVSLDALEQRLEATYFNCFTRRVNFEASINAVISQCLHFLEALEKMLEEDPDEVRATLRRQLPYLRQAIALREQEPTMVEHVENILASKSVPDHLKNTLVALAKDADTAADAVTGRVKAFEHQVENWFSRSMERASGVYKRNARGVAILIGCLIAVSTNADTLYVVNRLSKDAGLRASITEAANALILQSSGSPDPNAAGLTDEKLATLKETVNTALEDLPLPIGWDPVITAAQTDQAGQWRVPILRRIAGWLVTGIAISMGASFWYSLLGKVVRVRNTGDVPPDSRSSD
ncbi:MAG: hypothetical protein ACFB4J_09855 [Elainellaceae cyanobacterium]